MIFYSERIAQGLCNSVRSLCTWGDGVRKQIDLIVVTELVKRLCQGPGFLPPE